MTDTPFPVASPHPSQARSVSGRQAVAAGTAIAASSVAVLLFAVLHVLGPEFDPSRRVISEYANGRYGWVLSLMFASWGLASWTLALALRPHLHGRAGKIGLALLAVAGFGQVAAGIFDIHHPLHDLTAVLGGLGLPAAAVIISLRLRRDATWSAWRRPLLITANLTWLSQVAMIGTLALFMATYVQAGGDMTVDPMTISTLPDGVIALVGWANRLLVLAYIAWVATVALSLVGRTQPEAASQRRSPSARLVAPSHAAGNATAAGKH